MSLKDVLKFVVPTPVEDPLRYERYGAIIKDRVTGRIVKHVQEVTSLGLENFPIPGNPLNLAMKVVQSAQLHRIQQTLNTVQTLATVGAIASVAAIGVSIAGFAAVIARLGRMEGKLDQLLGGNQAVRDLALRLHLKFDLMALAQLRGTLEGMSIALLSTHEARRRDTIRESIDDLAKLRHYYAGLLASPEFCARTSNELVALLDAQERLVAASQGELVGEFFLGDDLAVIRERRRLQQVMFDQVAWKTERELHNFALDADRRSKIDLTIAPQQRVERVKAITQIRAESTARLDSTVELVGFLRERNIDFDNFRAQVAEHARATGELLLFIAAEDHEEAAAAG